jgi:ATP-binding cassette subfamily B (MDR/TAP) protein 7
MSARPQWRGLTCLAATCSGGRVVNRPFRVPALSPRLLGIPPVGLGAHRLFTTSPRRLVPGRGRPVDQTSPTPETPNASINLDQPTKAISEKSQAKADWRIILQLARNIWPKDSNGVKIRVAGALGLLIAGKLLNVQVPFFFKYIVDSLNVPITESTTVWVLAGASIAGCKLW